tara:strand:+ start:739 stop:1437 length:699 start_codon:yes stop_codon:yes gene_type:complete
MSGENFANFQVFLELQRRNDKGIDQSGNVNRIPLMVDSITINTSKTVLNMGVPFSGAVTGESLNLAFDTGMAQKTVNITGQLLGQTISKQRDGESAKSRKMTSFELAQLIHTYVDSSTFQDDQSLNKLVILLPSRVNHAFEYRDAADEDKDLLDLPRIPFTFKNRGYDNVFTSQGSNDEYYASWTGSEADSIGLMGFIRSFNTTMSGAEFPAVGFTLDFEEAYVLAENFLDG